jgi:hypothetical protein
MVGFPKTLNSKFDYEYARENFPREQWQPAFKELLDGRLQWYNIGKLDSPDKGKTDATHKVVENPGQDGQQAEYYQYELQEDPDCLLFRLGYMVDEVTVSAVK